MRLLIIPVGTSPVHVLRMILGLPKDRFDKIILRTTAATSEYGHRILEIVSSGGYEGNAVESTDLETYLESLGDDWELDLALGPGRKQDAMSIIRAIISATGGMPRFWIDFRERTNKGNAKQGEYIMNLRNSSDGEDEGYLLPGINMEMACNIYNVDPEIFDKPWLEWDSRSCKVLLSAEDPDRPTELLEAIETQKSQRNSKARKTDKEIAREWESRWLGEASETREKFGLHAVIASHSRLPSVPGHWLSTKDRMKHHNFRGGSK